MPTRSFSPASRLAAIYRRWAGRRLLRRQQAHARLELRNMSDHELKDLGIGRSEIQQHAESAFQR